MPRLLPEEKAFIVMQPAIALALGVNAAVILAHIGSWLDYTEKHEGKYKKTHFHDGKWWTYNTYEKWHEKTFIWISVPTIIRIFRELGKQGVVERRPHGNQLKGHWVTINYERLRELVAETPMPKGSKPNGRPPKSAEENPHQNDDSFQDSENPHQNDDSKPENPHQNDDTTGDPNESLKINRIKESSNAVETALDHDSEYIPLDEDQGLQDDEDLPAHVGNDSKLFCVGMHSGVDMPAILECSQGLITSRNSL